MKRLAVAVVSALVLALAVAPAARAAGSSGVFYLQNPETLNFGDVQYGTSAPVELIFENQAEGTLSPVIDLSGVTLNPEPGLNACSSGTAIPSDGTCRLYVVWTPQSLGPITASVTFSIDGLAPQTWEFTGKTVAAAISATGTAFGNVAVGSTGVTTVTVTNTGDGDGGIADSSVTGAGVELDGGTCSGAGYLPPGQTCTIKLKWSPTVVGAMDASYELRVTYALGTTPYENFPLTGTAVASGTAPPLPVTKVEAKKNGKVTWSAPSDQGGGPVTGYRVSVKAKGAKKFSKPVKVTGTSHKFKGLKPGKYVVKVVAVNADGVSMATTDSFVVAK